VGKGDMMFANSRRRKEKACGEVSLDIDSILALFKDLSVINTVVAISFMANLMKNLKRSVHNHTDIITRVFKLKLDALIQLKSKLWAKPQNFTKSTDTINFTFN